MKTVGQIVAQAALIVALAVVCVLADSRETLRTRLDSLAVETQVRKRSGLPIDDLEAASATLRDSIVGMRSTSPSADPEPDGASSAFGGRFIASVGASISSFLDSTVSFKPTGLFDWIIVGTGVVAVLSGLLLFIGIVVGRRKGAASKKKAAAAVRKINLSQTGPQAAIPDAAPKSGATYNFKGRPETAMPEPPPVPPELETLMASLRKATPQPAPPQQQPQPVAPPPPPPPPPTPPPLIAPAPDSPSSSKTRNANVPKAGSPGFSDSVVADSKSGLSDLEISKRYQISVDQVRLILRMNQDQ